MNSRFALALAIVTSLGFQMPVNAAAPASASSGTQPAKENDKARAENISPAQASEPVDVSSDAAHVDETSRVVVLTGNVIAKQGDVTLRADTVTVHYLAGAAQASPAGPSEKPGTSHGKIDRLEAHGNVVVTRPGEVVKGDSAIYEMIDRRILMTGNVVATRDGNVVRGDHLTVDLVKQTLQLQADQQTGRVRAVFTPPSKDAKP
jgi:lipopolysaccharide export system protein LptA